MLRRSRNVNYLQFPVIHPPAVVLLVQLRFVNTPYFTKSKCPAMLDIKYQA